MEEKKIKRINELWEKQKNEGLTEKEKTEQEKLRQQYIKEIKADVKKQIKQRNNTSSNGNNK